MPCVSEVGALGGGFWVLVGFVGSAGFRGFCGFCGFWWVLVGSCGFRGFWWVLVGSGGFWWVLLGSFGFCWVPWVLLGSVGSVGSCGFCWVWRGFVSRSPLELIRTHQNPVSSSEPSSPPISPHPLREKVSL